MRRGDVIDPAGHEGPDEVSFGGRPPRGRGRASWLLIAAAAAIVAAVVLVNAGGRGRTAPPHAHPHQPPLPFGVTEMGHPLLGVRADWELYGYGPGGVARIQFARGQITWTVVPALASNGPLALVADAGEAIIRPIDRVPGYAVPDGQHVRTLTGALSHGGTVLPGPRPGTVWVQPGFGSTTMPLVRLDGRDTGESMRLPSHGPWLASPDGQGYALLSGVQTGAVYDVRPGGVHRIAGTLAAVGPTRWLVADCHSGRRCAYAVVDAANKTRRRLPGLMPAPASMSGVIAPDGSTAAVFRTVGGRLRLHLINLASGADRTVAMPPGQESGYGQTLAWSPDSRWLFAIDAHGGLAAVNAGTHLVASLGIALPPLIALAVPAGGPG